jgi:hypothetical protein
MIPLVLLYLSVGKGRKGVFCWPPARSTLSSCSWALAFHSSWPGFWKIMQGLLVISRNFLIEPERTTIRIPGLAKPMYTFVMRRPSSLTTLCTQPSKTDGEDQEIEGIHREQNRTEENSHERGKKREEKRSEVSIASKKALSFIGHSLHNYRRRDLSFLFPLSS